MEVKTNSLQNLKEILKTFELKYLVGPKGARFILEDGEIERLYWNEERSSLVNYNSKVFSEDSVDIGSAFRKYYKLNQIREIFFPDILKHWVDLHNDGVCRITLAALDTKHLKMDWKVVDTFNYGLCYEVSVEAIIDEDEDTDREISDEEMKVTKLYYSAFGEALEANETLGIKDKSLLNVSGIAAYVVLDEDDADGD